MTRSFRLLSAALALLAIISVFGRHARAQEAATPATQATPAAQATPEPQTSKLRFLAFDSKGHAVDVKREDIHVYVDGVEQPLTSFAVEVSPASYGLVVDNSGSLRSLMSGVVGAAQALALYNGPSDETFVVRFVGSDNIKIMQEMTTDKTRLVNTMSDMFVEGGQTALLDAVHLSSSYLTKKALPNDNDSRRRALVLITDGEDRASFYKTEQVLNLLRAGGVQVFAIGFVSTLEREWGYIKPVKREKSKDLLEKLTAETGGRAFYPEKIGELRDAIVEINKSLRTQYVVGYAPAAPTADNKMHKIEIKAFGANGTDKLKVVIRPERGAPASEEKKEEKKKD